MIKKSFCEVLKISSGITTCLEVIIFLGVTNYSKVTFLLRVTVFLVKITYSVKSTCANNAYTKGACIGIIGVKNANVRDIDIVKYLEIHL